MIFICLLVASNVQRWTREVHYWNRVVKKCFSLKFQLWLGMSKLKLAGTALNITEHAKISESALKMTEYLEELNSGWKISINVHLSKIFHDSGIDLHAYIFFVVENFTGFFTPTWKIGMNSVWNQKNWQERLPFVLQDFICNGKFCKHINSLYVQSNFCHFDGFFSKQIYYCDPWKKPYGKIWIFNNLFFCIKKFPKKSIHIKKLDDKINFPQYKPENAP